MILHFPIEYFIQIYMFFELVHTKTSIRFKTLGFVLKLDLGNLDNRNSKYLFEELPNTKPTNPDSLDHLLP